MTDQKHSENISRVIWEWMDEKNCWHEWQFYRGDECSYFHCINRCKKQIHQLDERAENPSLTYDRNLHLVRLAELKAVEVFGRQPYIDALFLQFTEQEKHFADMKEAATYALILAATASAAQRATAIYNLIKEGENG